MNLATYTLMNYPCMNYLEIEANTQLFSKTTKGFYTSKHAPLS